MSTTILSQIKKYNIEDDGAKMYVRTRDGVTDDQNNYRPHATNINYSHIYPDDKKNQTISSKGNKKAKKVTKKTTEMQEKLKLNLGNQDVPAKLESPVRNS